MPVCLLYCMVGFGHFGVVVVLARVVAAAHQSVLPYVA